ncbi:heme/hemin ABC transporter substrate-binding protein [Arenibaculum pallidiluteum]|uniref:heme/hemin ABC transporter substrate-binding protein n=1 Tax=Arenibaculum pallidiluteum TaxID=2812559 RepID=UPI001A97CDFF|nr:ABC transporter substrate-binding protein [Arenibaculum pallidiluteum]
MRLTTGLALLLWAAAASPAAAATVAEGAAVAPGGRILSLGAAVTEIVFALDSGDRLVGADSSSIYPPDADRLPKVGYVRALGAEGLLSLSPDLVLATEEAGPPAAIEALAAAGVPVARVGEGTSVAAALARISAVGAAIGKDVPATTLRAGIERDLATLAAAMAAAAPARPRVMFVLSAGRGGPMVAGTGTAADSMITLAGGANAIDGYAGYKPLAPEAAATAEPEVILTTTQALESLGGADALLDRPEIAATPAGRARRLLAFDAAYLLGFGPRMAQAATDLARALHPGLALPDLASAPGAP